MRMNFLKFHPFTLFFLLIAFFTGYFKYVIYLMSLIFIHELGHVSAGIICEWNIKKIVLLPFGGMTYFEEKLNRPVLEELFIVLLGPIYQILFYFLLCILGFKTDLLININYFLLIFNLLPIYPLDGAKIVLLLFEKFFSYYNSHIYIILISLITLIINLFFYNDLLYIMIFIFLLYKVISLREEIKDIFFKFLLERYLYRFSFRKKKNINKLKSMKRDYYHIFKINDKLIEEKDILELYFGQIENSNT